MKTTLTVKYKIILTLWILSSFLTACGDKKATPTSPSSEQIFTEIAMQVSGGLTQTAAALQASQPIFTEMPAIPAEPPTEEAAPTLGIATLAVEAAETPAETTANPAPTQAADDSTSKCKYRVLLAYDSIQDGKLIEENKTFTRIWLLTNVGDCAWPIGTYLRFVGGDIMNADATQIITDKAIPPGERVRVESLMQTPKLPKGVFEMPLQSNWMLGTPEGRLFGVGPDGKGHLWTSIVVCFKKGCK